MRPMAGNFARFTIREDKTMSKTGEFVIELHNIRALDEALRHQLVEAEYTLNALFNAREKAVRLANSGRWDHSQYILDDLLQQLADVSENLANISALPAPLNQFLAA